MLKNTSVVSLMKVEKGIQISVVMGSQSDWQTMQEACDLLEKLDVSFEKKIVSAHRTPDRLYEYADSLRKRRVKVVIAGAGGAAHLPGMIASKTNIPVIGVPISATDLRGVDSLYSIVQMPRGYPVATMAIGAPGAFNAAIFAIQILALSDNVTGQKIQDWRNDITTRVKDEPE
jgi:5-(carboxyamino)imidazole ribonucleotide mutase